MDLFSDGLRLQHRYHQMGANFKKWMCYSILATCQPLSCSVCDVGGKLCFSSFPASHRLTGTCHQPRLELWPSFVKHICPARRRTGEARAAHRRELNKLFPAWKRWGGRAWRGAHRWGRKAEWKQTDGQQRPTYSRKHWAERKKKKKERKCNMRDVVDYPDLDLKWHSPCLPVCVWLKEEDLMMHVHVCSFIRWSELLSAWWMLDVFLFSV